MRMSLAGNFDRSMDYWRAGLQTPWARLRYTLYQHNLKRHLPDAPLHILDVGGGSGSDAIPLVQAGYEVTLLDFSRAMLDEAEQSAQALGLPLEVHQADLFEIPALFPQPVFDAVICHNVIQYVADMPGAVRAICAPLKPGGIVSVVNINRYSDALQAALLQLDLEAALDLIGARESYNPGFDTTLTRYAAAEMLPALQAAGCDLLGDYGVLCATGYIYDNERKADPAFFAKLENLEIALSDQYPYTLLARFFQLIGRKR
jgi:S-adenosylmethionine-dependent methyltransferase